VLNFLTLKNKHSTFTHSQEVLGILRRAKWIGLDCASVIATRSPTISSGTQDLFPNTPELLKATQYFAYLNQEDGSLTSQMRSHIISKCTILKSRSYNFHYTS